MWIMKRFQREKWYQVIAFLFLYFCCFLFVYWDVLNGGNTSTRTHPQINTQSAPLTFAPTILSQKGYKVKWRRVSVETFGLWYSDTPSQPLIPTPSSTHMQEQWHSTQAWHSYCLWVRSPIYRDLTVCQTAACSKYSPPPFAHSDEGSQSALPLFFSGFCLLQLWASEPAPPTLG